MFGSKSPISKVRETALESISFIRHRGPDWSGIYSDDKSVLCHERLSIVDETGGKQPLINAATGDVLIANAEIYNHLELQNKLKKPHLWQTQSDCEVILYLYEEYGPQCVEMLSGIFAFVLYDKRSGDCFVARDHLGICPLYVGWDKQGAIWFASELKALDEVCEEIKEFPPGTYYVGKEKKFTKWYKPQWSKTQIEQLDRVPIANLRIELETAVKRQMMADVPFGVLISGGLDSSLIAVIASKHYKQMRLKATGEIKAKLPKKLYSFSIGLRDSPDLTYAKKVASYLGTNHHEIIFTEQEGLDALRDVIYHVETFDVTTIRASTPMYLMARKIKSTGIKMVLSGEGADEMFGGYLYFHMAPSAKEFHEETVRKLFSLSKYDCLRANKSTAAWGVETRVPFLDKEFLEYAMAIDPSEKLCPGPKIEKEILRKAFQGYLPDEILWRQKEQFSDGVGYSWIASLKQHGEETVTDEMLGDAEQRFRTGTPTTKEAYMYREIFNEVFQNKTAALTVPTGPSIACSTPTAFRWSKEFEKMNDPSGRAVKLHQNTLSQPPILATV
ncbi:MAG: asparagine synthase B [Candidatus Micrarchaeota archaeon]|nr:asparagine synthase B [Candidatus Micrarchaeota archaeon]